MTVAENIRRLRKEKGITQKQLASNCGMTESALRQYELGYRNPKLETTEKIAKALGCEISDIDENIIRIRLPEIEPEIIERTRIEKKLINDKENVTPEEIKVLSDYYKSGQFIDSFNRVVESAKKAFGALTYGYPFNLTLSEDENPNENYNDPLSSENSHSFASSEEEYNGHIKEHQKQEEKNLITDYRKLNDTGQSEARKRVKELTEIPRYTNPPEPPEE